MRGTKVRDGKGPDIILMHGVLADRHQMKTYFDMEGRVFAIDLPGHGKSSDLADSALDQTYKELTAFCVQKNIKKPIIIAYSLSGFIIQAMLKRGFKAKGVVIIAAGADFPKYEIVEKKALIKRAGPLFDKYAEHLAAFAERVRTIKDLPRFQESGRDVQSAYGYLSELYEELPVPRELLNVPMLVCAGEKDLIVPLKYAQQLARKAPKGLFMQFELDHNAMALSKEVREYVQRFVNLL